MLKNKRKQHNGRNIILTGSKSSQVYNSFLAVLTSLSFRSNNKGDKRPFRKLTMFDLEKEMIGNKYQNMTHDTFNL